ncbi:MAG: P-II family nitrogen regulator [Lachnospiraceae bacterium]|nr:P-II family nitrogen regulator [Lachnospiraceae bacterium]
MSDVSFMFTITDRDRVEQFSKLYREHGVEIGFVSYGHGTAASEILDTFGLEDAEKALLMSVILQDSFPAIRKDLEQRYHIDVPGTGVVFTVPMSSIGGKRQLSILLGRQRYIPKEESEMKNTENELIIVIANRGYTEGIMDAARSAGVRGGTVLHAKGTAMQGKEKFLGFVLAEEKEMIIMVVKTASREGVMRAIMDQSEVKAAQAVCFSLPVSATAGMRLADPTEE